MNKKARTRLIVATAVIVVVFVAGVVYLVTQQGAYYRQVSELTGDDDGKNVQVGGRVIDGSIARDDAGVHFTMQDLSGASDTVAVSFSGQTPNTFAAGVDVVVVGEFLAAKGLIAADELQTKCPSKYEGKGTTPTAPAAAQ